MPPSRKPSTTSPGRQGFYRDVLSGKIPYKSNLLPSDDSDGTDEK